MILLILFLGVMYQYIIILILLIQLYMVLTDIKQITIIMYNL